MGTAKEVRSMGLTRTEAQRQVRSGVQGAGSPPGTSGDFVSLVEQAIRPIVEPPAASITPEEFMWRYRRMQVTFTDPDTGQARTLPLDYRWYRNNSPHVNPRHHSNMDEKSRLLRSRPHPTGALRNSISYTIHSSAMPHEVRAALAFALEHRVPRHWPGGANAAGLERYCTRTAKIGIDCCNFVNNYFRSVNHPAIVTSENPRGIRNIPGYASRGTRRNSPEEIRDNDVLIWVGSDGSISAHIAVVDMVLDTRRLTVVESSAHPSKNGLTSSLYEILNGDRVRRGVFLVDRGRSRSQVRIYGIGTP